ncbi:MAG: Crp/Fnr family transcriptional regulator [Gemmatimonadaceae bacterium]
MFVTGDRADSVYLVKSGLARTSLASKNGELMMQLYVPGQIFGELCFCSRTRRESAAAVESSEIIEIPLTDLVEQLRRTPESALDFIVALTEQLAASNERLHSLAFESAMERLCRTLLLLTETLGEESPDGIHITRYIHQEQLAQLVAARREVVSGLLNRLRERGLIRYPRKGQISVHKVQLQEYLKSLRESPDD